MTSMIIASCSGWRGSALRGVQHWIVAHPQIMGEQSDCHAHVPVPGDRSAAPVILRAMPPKTMPWKGAMLASTDVRPTHGGEQRPLPVARAVVTVRDYLEFQPGAAG